MTGLIASIRFMSPLSWKRIATSPRALAALAVAYNQMVHMTPSSEHAQLWDYEVVLHSAPHGRLHVIYVPRIHVDDRPKDSRRFEPHIRMSPGIETHVLIDCHSLRVERAYFGE
jgi:hypothetical protein